MKILIVGHGNSGKDYAANWFKENTNLKVAGSTSTSTVLINLVRPFYPAGLSDGLIYEQRRSRRELWKAVAEQAKSVDPAALVKKILENSDIVTGVRSLEEIDACYDLFDHIIWIDRNVPIDSTLEFGLEVADIIIENWSTLEVFEESLETVAKELSIYTGAYLCQRH